MIAPQSQSRWASRCVAPQYGTPGPHRPTAAPRHQSTAAETASTVTVTARDSKADTGEAIPDTLIFAYHTKAVEYNSYNNSEAAAHHHKHDSDNRPIVLLTLSSSSNASKPEHLMCSSNGALVGMIASRIQSSLIGSWRCA